MPQGGTPRHESLTIPGDRFGGIDATRAVAALAVLASHLIQTLTWRIPGWEATAGDASGPVHRLTGMTGYWGVGLFLVVSGACIHLPAARRRVDDPGAQLDVRAFYRRRFFRIYPPYLGAAVLSAAVAWAMPQQLVPSTVIRVPTAAQVVSHLLLVQTVVPGHELGINGVFWTIALEAQFYALYPLLLAVRRRTGMAGLCAILLGVAVASRMVEHSLLPRSLWSQLDSSFLRRGWEFCLGMWVAERLARSPRTWPGGRLVWAVIAVGTLAASLSPFAAIQRPRPWLWPVLFMVAVEAAARWRPSPALPERLARWLGERSYSLYLVHPVGLALGIWLVPGWAAARGPGCAAMLLCTAVVFVAFYSIVERPFAIRPAAPRSVAA